MTLTSPLQALEVLLHERYQTREQLVTRIEDSLGANCFGGRAWDDVFYRDMRVVKDTLCAAGYTLKYSRRAEHSGYYLAGEGEGGLWCTRGPAAPEGLRAQPHPGQLCGYPGQTAAVSGQNSSAYMEREGLQSTWQEI